MDTSSEVPGFAEESASMLKELQSWWEIPSMAQYISLFREAFNLPEIEIEDLEKGLIDDCIKGPNEWLQNLVIAFLKSILPCRINPNTWEIQLKKLIKKKWSVGPFAEKENPFEEDKPFHELSLRSKVEIIYCFCLYRLDNNDITDIMKSMDAEALRVQKLGLDNRGNTFWYFYGTRLYKEEPIKEKKTWDEEWKEQKTRSFAKRRSRGRPAKRQKATKKEVITEVEEVSKNDKFMNASEKSRWSVVCDTLEEWVNFAEKFKNSKSKNEKSLFQIIQENFLPTLSKLYEEKERKLQEKVRELLPAREKIVTRRETRRMRGDTGGDINYALLNGYDSDDESLNHSEDFRMMDVKSRAERLEERKKRATEASAPPYESYHKRVKHNQDNTESSDSPETTSSIDFSENGELDLMSQMIKLLSSVKLHKDAWPFLYPVDEEEAPGYYEIIKEPVDLSTIESKLYKGVYETVGDLDEDFSRMVSNCILYNGEFHAFSKMAQTLRKLFRKEVANLLEMFEAIDSSSNDSIGSSDSQYHSSSNSNSSSPPHESSVVESNESNEHKKVKGKKKKKKHNTDALDLLAQASDIAVQDNIVNSPSPPQKSSVSQEVRPVPCYMPSTNMPCNSASTSSPGTNKITIPASSTSFITMTSTPQEGRSKPVIVRAKASPISKRSSPIENAATTSLNIPSNITSNNIVQQANVNQTFNPQTVPMVLPRSPPNQNNSVPAVTMQSNVCMPNRLPVVQRVVIPAGTQLQNAGQQYVYASPQNTIRILNKEQSMQLQNNVGQLNQGFVKVVPQIMQVSKDGMQTMQSFQFQTVSPNNTPTFTQVAQNPQFVNVPYVVSNQNSLTNSTSQPTMTYQTYQMPPRQMQINGQGNG